MTAGSYTAPAQNSTVNGWLNVGSNPTPTGPSGSPAAGDAIVQRSLVVGATGFPTNNNPLGSGNAYIMGNTWLNSSLVFRDNATGNHRWMINASNADAKLRIAYGWDWTKGMELKTSGDVKFFQKVSIGNVDCSPRTNCPTGNGTILGINNLTLAVGGRIGARQGVHVLEPNVAWPDYVFTPTYQLSALAEVEQFITAHKHLPDVPSAAQVQAEGVELVTMQATLLRKVEELTLHLIRLEKENNELRARVSKLEH